MDLAPCYTAFSGVTRRGEMEKEELLQEMARLEFVNDQLEAEVSDIDHLLRKVGFSEGLVSAQKAAEELLGRE